VAVSFRLALDPIACDGHGLCVELYPEGITFDDWGFPIVTRKEVPAEHAAHARRAVDACPKLALTIRREDASRGRGTRASQSTRRR
jgi:ferredoxin